MMNRRSIRLAGYLYSEPGYYFVTMCTQNRIPIFGHIDCDSKMILSKEGQVVYDELLKTSSIRQNMQIDEWVIMPDHIHFIIIITRRFTNEDIGRREVLEGCTAVRQNIKILHRDPNSLSSFIAQFKASTTRCIRSINRSSEKVWQRNYFERIIRNEDALHHIRIYIKENPEHWNAGGNRTT